MSDDLEASLSRLEQTVDGHLDYVKDLQSQLTRAELKASVLLEALKYARRFLKPEDHDVTFADRAIAFAEQDQ